MIRVAILDDYQAAAHRFADWPGKDEGVEVHFFHQPIEQSDAAATLADFDAVVAMRERMRFDAALIEKLPNLRLIITTAMVNAAIDMQAAAARGIMVCGTTSIPSPTPELTWGLVLALARNIAGETGSVRAGGWQTSVGTDLAGKTIGIVGLGKVGRVVARYARAFEMQVVAWSPNLTPERAAEGGAELAPSLQALLSQSDIVTLHMVLSPSTRGMIGAGELAQMKPHALLVNTSRAGLVETPALLDALNGGRLRGAALDVFDTEPMSPDDPLRNTPNLLVTPHIGYVTERNYALYYGGAAEDLRAWMAGRPIRVLAAPENQPT
jgi:phosphoglycerate dehydrogenase-like enzyme